ncbi:slightly ste11-like protein [Marasmius crinis-equi]|uniref:Slightly ste11-like protein n=1 Tax=Marasmius crinis-equi TaxID=585013 RepID=A0ABR3F738_9AGAR
MPSSRQSATSAPSRAPRPENSFLLYRRDAVSSGAVADTFMNDDGIEQRKPQTRISKEVAKMWNTAPQGVKTLYTGFAEMKKKEYVEKYGEEYDHLRTSRPRTSNEEPSDRIRRPENAFILYRRDVLSSGTITRTFIDDNGAERAKNQMQLSKEIGQMWHHCPEALKARYIALAEQKKEEHKQMYPDYKFSPKASRKGVASSGSPISRSKSSSSSRSRNGVTSSRGLQHKATSTSASTSTSQYPFPSHHHAPFPQAQNGCVDPSWLALN